MLVLSRREGERIKIGDAVTVTVVRLGADKVRIGIEAPSDVLILRGELEQNVALNHNKDCGTIRLEEVVTRPLPGLSLDSVEIVQSLVG